MDARATRRGVPAVVIWGGFGALAWAALTVLTGGSSAHADDSKGPLDGLTSLVSETVSTVTAPLTPVVTQVVAPVVTQVVAPVVTQVVAPVPQAAPAVVDTVTATVAQVPVAGTIAAPVLEATSNAAQAVTDPVTDLLTDAPTSTLTDPVLEAVAGLPVVGRIVVDAGVIGLVDDVVGVVDDTTGLLGGVVEVTVPPVLEALTPTTPALPIGPGLPREPVVDPAVPPVAVPLVAVGASAPMVTRAPGSGLPPFSDHSTTATGSAADGDAPAAPSDSPPGAPLAPVAPTSSAGSGGSAAAAHARLSDVGPLLLPACGRVSGASDDDLPSSPVADTDVSPG